MPRAALERGLRIPEDLSLIGFDNIEFSGIVHPPLTTVHQPKYEMGYAAVEILLRMARDKDKRIPEHRLLGVEIVERRSCREVLPKRLRTPGGRAPQPRPELK